MTLFARAFILLAFAAVYASSVPIKTMRVQTSIDSNDLFPLVINTWAGTFSNATEAGYQAALATGATGVDAVVSGCGKCEELQCDGTVGYGGSPDGNGETTLDALVMNGTTMDVGAVGCLRRVKNAIGVAYHVMENTQHTLLVGDLATQFALEMGFPETDLQTPASEKIYVDWKANQCQPNFWRNVQPNHTESCGPYKPDPTLTRTSNLSMKQGRYEMSKPSEYVSKNNHDTIAMIAVMPDGQVAAGTSTNGANHKVPGRVGDSPVMGAGAYADSDVGGCGATGDGDTMMRFLPCYQVVQNMRAGMSPTAAAQDAIDRIAAKYPTFQGALVAVNKKGEHGGACNAWTFEYSLRTPANPNVQVFKVTSKPVDNEGR